MRNKFISFLLVILIFPGINIDIAKANGEDWTARTQASNSSWYSIAYGNGLFVAVSLNGTVMTSPDGINWTSRTAAATNQWTAITYGNGLFVAVGPTGTGNRVMTSPDGINWTSRESAADYEWRGIAYGNGVFVAVNWNGNGNKVMTSTDGFTWTLRASAVLGNWMDITYGNEFVAVSYDGGHKVMTSPDGIAWTAQAAATNNNASDNQWFGVTYGNSLYVAVSRSGTNNRVMTSSNGITWTSRTSASNNNWYDVTYGNGVFVAVSYDGIGNQVMTSTDGSNWSTRNSLSGVSNNWRSVTYGGGLFVAVSESGTNQVMTSGTFLAPPAFTLSSSSETRTVNTAATGFTINSTGGTITSFAINATPPGMSFNTPTGALTGTPNTVADATAYTITATNTSGTAQRTFTLTVGPVAPAFTISSSSESKTVNTAISGYTISSTGGAIASYAISPAAPAGLTFNTTTGLLSGTPTEVAAATAYTITATNATSSTTQTFTLTVTAVPVVANNADNSAAQAAQAEAARRANEQRQMGDLSSVLPLINELIKEIEDGLKSTSAPKKKSSTSKTKQSSQAKPEKKSNSEPLTIPIPPATEPEAQSQAGELVSISHNVGFGLSASWINSSNIKALRGFIAGIEESFEVERIVIQGYAQPTKIGLSDIDIARAKAVKKLLIKDGLDYPIVVEGMGEAESKKGDLSRLAVVTVEGKIKKQN